MGRLAGKPQDGLRKMGMFPTMDGHATPNEDGVFPGNRTPETTLARNVGKRRTVRPVFLLPVVAIPCTFPFSDSPLYPDTTSVVNSSFVVALETKKEDENDEKVRSGD